MSRGTGWRRWRLRIWLRFLLKSWTRVRLKPQVLECTWSYDKPKAEAVISTLTRLRSSLGGAARDDANYPSAHCAVIGVVL